MMREYFGEPAGAALRPCDSCAGLDSEVFDPGAADQRHDLHAATDFHARKRRRKRGERAAQVPMQAQAQAQAPVQTRRLTTVIPELLPPLAPVVVGAPAETEMHFDEGVWVETPEAGSALAGDVVMDGQELEGWIEPGESPGGERRRRRSRRSPVRRGAARDGGRGRTPPWKIRSPMAGARSATPTSGRTSNGCPASQSPFRPFPASPPSSKAAPTIPRASRGTGTASGAVEAEVAEAAEEAAEQRAATSAGGAGGGGTGRGEIGSGTGSGSEQ